MEEQERGVSFGEICHVIFSKKWLVLIITAVIAVVGTLAITLGYNPSQTSYVTSFTVNYAGSNNEKYPDNSTFDYRSAIVEVINSDEQFNSIDANKLYANISITRNSYELATDIYRVDYSIKIGSKIFKNDAQAVAFITALADYPLTYINNWAENLDHSANLANYDTATDYQTKINALYAQAEYIRAGYESLLESNDFDVDSIRTIYISASNKLFNVENKIDYVNSQLVEKKYVMNMDTLRDYAEEFVTLKRELALNESVWNRLFPNVSSGDANNTELSDELLKLAFDIEKAKLRIADIIEYFELNGQEGCFKKTGDEVTSIEMPEGELAEREGKSRFDERLESLKNDLKALTDEYGRTLTDSHNKASSIVYNGAPVSTDGGMSVVVSIILSLVVGFIIACVVALIMAMPKHLKAKRGEIEKGTDSE